MLFSRKKNIYCGVFCVWCEIFELFCSHTYTWQHTRYNYHHHASHHINIQQKLSVLFTCISYAQRNVLNTMKIWEIKWNYYKRYCLCVYVRTYIQFTYKDKQTGTKLFDKWCSLLFVCHTYNSLVYGVKIITIMFFDVKVNLSCKTGEYFKIIYIIWHTNNEDFVLEKYNRARDNNFF